ncbi:MAG: hypothetical protein KMY55_11125 [Dethiosulfatibacter sp.]|nr:hypothetical protein [Dethiosulfatibacter sp.]
MTKLTKFFGFMIIVLLLLNLTMFNEIKSLGNTINNLKSDLYNLDRSINNINNNVRSTLDEFKAEQGWIYSYAITPTGYDSSNDSTSIGIEASFNDLLAGEEIFVLITKATGEEVEKINVTPNVSNLQLNHTINVSVKNDYELVILGESDLSSRSETLEVVYLKSMLSEIFIAHGFSNKVDYTKDGHLETIHLDLSLTPTYMPSEFLQDYFKDVTIAEMKLELYSNDVLIETISILNNPDWTFSTINYTDGTVNNQLDSPIKILSENLKYELMINGSYSFRDSIENTEKIKGAVKMVDSNGNNYTFELWDLVN